MDTNASASNISCENIHKLDKNSAVVKTENTVHRSFSPPILDNGGFVSSPVTPDLIKDRSDLTSSFTSPLTFLSSPMNEDDDEDEDDDCITTPKAGVFDPFAPGPENLMTSSFTPRLAPRVTGMAETCPGAPLKSVKKSRNIDLGLCRKLEFDI